MRDTTLMLIALAISCVGIVLLFLFSPKEEHAKQKQEQLTGKIISIRSTPKLHLLTLEYPARITVVVSRNAKGLQFSRNATVTVQGQRSWYKGKEELRAERIIPELS